VDFLDLYAIRPEGVIAAPREAARVVLRVTGIEGTALDAASDRQWLHPYGDIICERIVRPGADSLAPDPAFSKPSPYIESNAPAILAASRKAFSGGQDRLDSLARLARWVDSYMTKTMSGGLPSALAVLQSAEGDCNEHSVLFVALARAAGIPARIQLGVVYQQGRFYYHAWPAAWADGNWVEYDPTFGQTEADPSRLALAAGDISAVSSIVNRIGRIGITIVEAH
ncbi:MAG: transglutaminase domain-containing protein, partial [Calditrichaeota bacterium]|nr:transglutaminase domain-containing protein [Calditrichota bacterium]